MSMDAARLRFDECPACGNGVDENDPDRPHTIDQGMTWHLNCWESVEEENGLAEQERRFSEFWGDTGSYAEDRERQDLRDAGRGHLT